MKDMKLLFNLIESDTQLDCRHLENIAKAIQDLREDLLFEYESAGMAPMAESQFMKALSFLELAEQEIRLANYHQIRELGEMR